MTPVHVTATELAHARKAGFKRKKPKMPKTKTETTYNAYVSKFNAWAKELKEKAAIGKRKTDIKEKFAKLRTMC